MRHRRKRSHAMLGFTLACLGSHIILSEHHQKQYTMYVDEEESTYEISSYRYGEIDVSDRGSMMSVIDFQTVMFMTASSIIGPNMTIAGGYVIDDPQSDYLNEPSILPKNFLTKPIKKLNNRKHDNYITTAPKKDNNSTGKQPDYEQGKNVINFDNIRITLDTNALENFDAAANYATQIDSVVNTMLPLATDIWEPKLSMIYPPDGNLVLSYEACGPLNVSEMHRTTGISDTDLIIYVTGEECASVEGEPTYAYGAPCQYDEFNRPIAGYLVVCLDDISVIDGTISGTQIQMNSYVQAHEIGHILGFVIDLFQYYYNFDIDSSYGTTTKEVTCVNGSLQTLPVPNNLRQIQVNGATFYEIITHAVVNTAKNQFNCDENLVGVRLQPDTESCFGSAHWSERIIDEDLMSPLNEIIINNSLDSAITPLTLAVLEDSGWYKANYTLSSSRSFGFGAGCDFLTKPCIVDGEIPEYSSGFFCNETIPFINGEPDSVTIQFGCDVDYVKKAVCDLANYLVPPASNSGQDPPPDAFQYFESPDLGAYFNAGADYCPRVKNYLNIDCTKSQQETDFSYDDLGPNSRCFETNIRESVCLQAECNSNTGKIEGYLLNNNQQFVCDYDGQVIDYEVVPAVSSFKFICPRAIQFCKFSNPDSNCPSNCSSRGYCNFDADVPICECADPSDTSPDCSLTVSSDPVLIGSDIPSIGPSMNPSATPSTIPSTIPSYIPSMFPSSFPSNFPSSWPSAVPSLMPTSFPSVAPSLKPSASPSLTPTGTPSTTPSATPSTTPSTSPSTSPSVTPSTSPSSTPSEFTGKKKKSYKSSNKSSKKESSESKSKHKKDYYKSSSSSKSPKKESSESQKQKSSRKIKIEIYPDYTNSPRKHHFLSDSSLRTSAAAKPSGYFTEREDSSTFNVPINVFDPPTSTPTREPISMS